MTPTSTKSYPRMTEEGFSVFELWSKYEDITTHFNDLLMRLRTQALAGVATLSTAVGIFAKTEAGESPTDVWLLAAFTILGLCLVWTAIWLIDVLYYNRLLAGAVHALERIELESKTKRFVPAIELSTLIEHAVLKKIPNKLSIGVKAFYSIILVALLGGAGVCLYEHATWAPAKKADRQPTMMITNQPPAPAPTTK